MYKKMAFYVIVAAKEPHSPTCRGKRNIPNPTPWSISLSLPNTPVRPLSWLADQSICLTAFLPVTY